MQKECSPSSRAEECHLPVQRILPGDDSGHTEKLTLAIDRVTFTFTISKGEKVGFGRISGLIILLMFDIKDQIVGYPAG